MANQKSKIKNQKWEARCPLCEGAAARRLVTKSGYGVVRCAECGLVYVRPRPSREELEARYSAEGYHAEVDEAERRRYFAARLGQLEGLVPRRGRVLDVGCSKGFFLDVARAEGWDPVGIDLNRKAVDEANARGLDVRHGELTVGLFPDASFDAVTLFDLIEHTLEPKALLDACHRVLRPGGVLMVATPNIGGLVSQVTYALFALTLGAWGHPTPPEHLVQFSRRTLLRLLGQSGFEALLVRSEHIPMAYSVGKLENSVMDVLAGRHRSKPKPSPTNDLGSDPAQPQARSCPPRPARHKRLLRRLLRRAVRCLCWSVVAPAGVVARGVGWGDSMLVIAQSGKPQPLRFSKTQVRHT